MTADKRLSVLQLGPTESRKGIGSAHGCASGAEHTFVKRGALMNVLHWCDNEWVSSKQTVEMMARML